MSPATDLKHWITEELYREPRGGRGYWIVVAFGLGAVGLAVLSRFVPSLAVGGEYVFLGIGVAAMGAAELVPAERIERARTLRIGAYVGFGLYAAWIFGPAFLAANLQVKLIAVAAVPVLLGYVWLLITVGEG